MKKTKVKKLAKKASPDKSSLDSIVDAYFDLAAEIGVDKITLHQLSLKTGLSPSNVKYHIDEHDNYLESLAIQLVRTDINLYLDENISKDRRSRSFNPLMSYAKHMLLWPKHSPRYAVFLLFIYYRTATYPKSKSPSGEGYQTILERAQSRVEGLLNEGIGAQLYDSPFSKDVFVRAFHALVLGQLVIHINLQKKFNADAALNTIELLLQQISKTRS